MFTPHPPSFLNPGSGVNTTKHLSVVVMKLLVNKLLEGSGQIIAYVILRVHYLKRLNDCGLCPSIKMLELISI